MYRVLYGNKFGNRRTAHGGVTYHSKKEATYAAELDLRKKAGDIKDWARQVRIPLEINGRPWRNYFIDFVITHNDGTIEYVEVKGFATEVWKMKWDVFEILYGDKPGVRLTIVR